MTKMKCFIRTQKKQEDALKKRRPPNGEDGDL